MSGVNGALNNNTFETINAAATAIISTENNRIPQPHVQKKRWRSWLRITWCFGYHKSRKRIGHAVLVPETTPSAAESSAAAVSSTQAPSITLPSIAPPSSPASFLQSEPPSVAHSPSGTPSLTSVSAGMYSPSGPALIFAIGPYAHETQLVSPPVFSTFTTEPSTAPFTPPPESVHLTTPSSPEVPFAQLLDPNNRNGEAYHDFHSYQLHPGSPAGHLISPRSAFLASGASSPFPDSDCGSNLNFQIQTAEPPKLPSFDKLSTYDKPKSCQGSGSLTPVQGSFLPSHRVSQIKLSPHPTSNRVNEISVNHRVSFELSAQQVLKCVENKALAWTKALTKFNIDAAGSDNEENSRVVTETPNDALQQSTGDHHKDPALIRASGKEFNFDNADGGDSRAPNIVPDWWANEKVAGKEGGSSNDWSFFPMIQPGLR